MGCDRYFGFKVIRRLCIREAAGTYSTLSKAARARSFSARARLRLLAGGRRPVGAVLLPFPWPRGPPSRQGHAGIKSFQFSFQRQLPESYVGTDRLTPAVTLTNMGTTPLNITPVTTTPADFGGSGAVYFVCLGLEQLWLGNFLRGRSVCE